MKWLFILIMVLIVLNAPAQVHVPFLESAPEIDGFPDPEVISLSAVALNAGDQGTESMQGSSQKADVRLAYGTSFLYIYAEIAADSLVFRDRGYQNGDGMLVVIGKPGRGGTPSREFYVLGFTAQPQGTSNWQTKFIWYRNVGLRMARLTDAKFKARQGDHKIVMECLIPWSEVYPYHPWLSGETGMNLAIVKAHGGNGKEWYFLRKDDRIQNEQSPRVTIPVTFEQPRITAGKQTYAVLSRNHFPEGDSLSIRFATAPSEEKEESFRVVIYSGEHTRVSSLVVGQTPGDTVSMKEKALPVAGLSAGGYQVDWTSVSGTSKGSLYFTILPEMSVAELQQELERRKQFLSPGSYSTLMFMLGDVKTGLDSLKAYETAYEVRTQLAEISNIIRSQRDILAEKGGILRRGFLSAVDTTYRPYSIKVPDVISPGNKYPLMVYLHGSGQDDRNILEQLPDYGPDMIILAPNGRGTSNCYTAGHAQEDIEEALRDAIRNYPVDTTKIILAGFSMGGYGVYRTFWEHPSRYKALAVFSGSPDLGRRWIGPEQPDFLEDRYLGPFAGKEIFIFHGTEDLNIPIGTTRSLAGKLEQTGARVTFIEETKGHESPGEGTISRFKIWLDHVLNY